MFDISRITVYSDSFAHVPSHLLSTVPFSLLTLQMPVWTGWWFPHWGIAPADRASWLGRQYWNRHRGTRGSSHREYLHLSHYCPYADPKSWGRFLHTDFCLLKDMLIICGTVAFSVTYCQEARKCRLLPKHRPERYWQPYMMASAASFALSIHLMWMESGIIQYVKTPNCNCNIALVLPFHTRTWNALKTLLCVVEFGTLVRFVCHTWWDRRRAS